MAMNGRSSRSQARTQIIEALDFEKKSEKNGIDFRSLFLYSLAYTT
jgi:hypothetical protein